MRLADVRDFVASLGIAEDENVYMHKMPEKPEQCIGVYPLKRAGRKIPIGGWENARYGILNVSMLIHWNKSYRQTEDVADSLCRMLQEVRAAPVNNQTIKFIILSEESPVDVGTDNEGICEMVIEAFFYYDRR